MYENMAIVIMAQFRQVFINQYDVPDTREDIRRYRVFLNLLLLTYCHTQPTGPQDELLREAVYHELFAEDLFFANRYWLV